MVEHVAPFFIFQYFLAAIIYGIFTLGVIQVALRFTISPSGLWVLGILFWAAYVALAASELIDEIRSRFPNLMSNIHDVD